MSRMFLSCCSFTALLMTACAPQDHSLHLETLAHIDSDTRYYLHGQLGHIGTDIYISTGQVGEGFIRCLESVKDERNAGGTDRRYFLVLQGPKTYYYSFRTIDNKIVRITPMRKADIGFKGGGAMYRAACDLSLLLKEKGG
jgi:hypothetical protein